MDDASIPIIRHSGIWITRYMVKAVIPGILYDRLSLSVDCFHRFSWNSITETYANTTKPSVIQLIAVISLLNRNKTATDSNMIKV